MYDRSAATHAAVVAYDAILWAALLQRNLFVRIVCREPFASFCSALSVHCQRIFADQKAHSCLTECAWESIKGLSVLRSADTSACLSRLARTISQGHHSQCLPNA
ncbi:hypothetical protein TRVL_07038 [Trypanosoma vivax]|nr:hypothetical protein TRVL_07038 [Trypanosoma vivax]